MLIDRQLPAHRFRDPRFRRFQGLCHDGSHWYFTTRSRLYKVTDDFAVVAQTGIPPELRRQGYNHFGDPDFARGARGGRILVPVEALTWQSIRPRTQPGGIAAFDAGLLFDPESSFLLRDRTDAPWCAVHPVSGLVFTSDFGGADRVVGYAMGVDGDAVESIRLRAPDGSAETVEGVQGGCFVGDDGRTLALSLHGDRDVRLYALPDGRRLDRRPIPYERWRRSELEGLTYRPGGGAGELHVALVNRSWLGRGDLVLHHFMLDADRREPAQ